LDLNGDASFLFLFSYFKIDAIKNQQKKERERKREDYKDKENISFRRIYKIQKRHKREKERRELERKTKLTRNFFIYFHEMNINKDLFCFLLSFSCVCALAACLYQLDMCV
jgi:hypothetical protein